MGTEWLARPRRAAGGGTKALSGRVTADTVAAAVETCLRASWSRTIAVPRGLGLPPIDRIVERS